MLRKLKNKVLHLFIGHIPYFVHENKDTKFYRCTICSDRLSLGPYNQLYKDKTNVI